MGCAVRYNLRTSFPSLTSIRIRDASGSEKGDWVHPKYADLCIGSLLFEVGVRKSTPWQLPHRILAVRKELEAVGISGTASELGLHLDEAKVKEIFDDEEIAISRALLQVECDSLK